MRDINRIERMLNKLKEIWTGVPDWRFAQLLSNFFYQNDHLPFYQEDEDLEKRIDFVLDQMKNKGKM